jgi:alpha-tubulin suppressor-like RCC1 family protein
MLGRALRVVLAALTTAACSAIVGFSNLHEVDECVKGCADASPPEGGPAVLEIAFGREHTCATMVDKTLRCWGLNASGQLGIGDTSPHLTPAVVQGMTDVAYVALGQLHTCAVTGDGKVRCWGSNSRGQLGIGAADASPHPAPLLVVGLAPTRKIQAGKEHTCAEMVDGTVQCWGSNVAGELGDGTHTDRPLPTSVKGVTGVKKLSAGGGQHNCAVLSDGSVWCWGSNSKWQLGAKMPAPDSPNSLQVPALSGASKVWVGFEHSCVLKADASVWCWGANDYGQLGNDTTNQTDTPVQVLTGVDSMGAGWRHTCAFLSTTSDMKCWGTNDHGQLGIPGVPSVHVPTLVPGIKTPNGGTKGEHTCVVVEDGGGLCWGWNDQGQLGDGTQDDRASPTQVRF